MNGAMLWCNVSRANSCALVLCLSDFVSSTTINMAMKNIIARISFFFILLPPFFGLYINCEAGGKRKSIVFGKNFWFDAGFNYYHVDGCTTPFWENGILFQNVNYPPLIGVSYIAYKIPVFLTFKSI